MVPQHVLLERLDAFQPVPVSDQQILRWARGYAGRGLLYWLSQAIWVRDLQAQLLNARLVRAMQS